jgi:SAM-dependent methyltransferase
MALRPDERMTTRKTRRLDPRQGYDLWAETYDETKNPVVAMDQRVVPGLLAPAPGEHVLDAACGTGRYFPGLLDAGCCVTGVDFAAGMLRVAARRAPGVPLVQADLQRSLPFRPASFDLVLAALVGEHLDDLAAASREIRSVLRPGGRLLFSVYHPEMAAAGIEANFERDGVEIRLGAHRHTTEDYREALAGGGFHEITTSEFPGDEPLVAALPSARKYLGSPVLLVLRARATGVAGPRG